MSDLAPNRRSAAEGSGLFIVDNSVDGWTGLEYLRQWCEISRSFDIATGFFEIGSLLLHSKKETFINDGDGAGAIEQEADAFASRELIPPEHESVLGQLHSVDDVTQFARSIGVAPGIVVGRLQHMGWWKHSEGNELRWTFNWGIM